MNEKLLNKLLEYIDARISEATQLEFAAHHDDYSYPILIELRELVAQKGGSDE